ncbi:MAG: hypothetical protein PHQ27_02825 [Victivallales bacterium]|nr:hypothetical protein [Victivallales bacterium]
MNMGHDFQHSLLHRMKSTFYRMTFTGHHLIGRKTNHVMIAINNSPEMGHRDAAYDGVVLLLRGHLFALPPGERLEVYRRAMELLHVAIAATREICCSSTGKQHDNESNVMNFLNLLGDTVHAAATLLSHQQVMVREDRKSADFFGFDLSFHFQNTDGVLADSEINLMRCVREMLDRSHDRLMQYRGHCCRMLAARELKRYHKAMAAYRQLYAAAYQLPAAVSVPEPESPSVPSIRPSGARKATPRQRQKTKNPSPRD